MAVKLKLAYDSADDIPEGYTDLYTEKDGKFTLTGIEGLKTQSDIDRQLEGNRKERTAHQKTKDKLKKLADALDLDVDDEDALDTRLGELSDKINRLSELEARGTGDGKLSDPERVELVDLRKEVGPLKAQVTKLTKEKTNLQTAHDTLKAERDGLSTTIKRGTIKEQVIAAARKAQSDPDFDEDIVARAERDLEIDDETGAVTQKDTGISVADWVEALKDSKPKYWPTSKGAGARGSDTGPKGANPWSAAKWNKTEQGKIRRDKGDEFAARMAEAAGSKLGATTPPAATQKAA